MEALNAVPFEVYLLIETGILVVLAVSALASRWLLHGSELGNFLSVVVLGSLLGFVLATLPWISMAITKDKSWPVIEVWPYWGDYSGPFTAFLLGNAIGLSLGCSYFYVRSNRKDAATKSAR
jgi:hypothetical protein